MNLIDNLLKAKAVEAESNTLFAAAYPVERRRADSWLDARIHDGKRGQFTEEKPVSITPVMAEVMLLRNVNNRKIRASKVQSYRRAIREGRWKVTHQGVAFDIDGVLRDGQHRLTAIAAEGRSVQMAVTFGMDPTSFAVIDTGGVRNAADVLLINKRGGGKYLATAARTMVIARSDYPRANPKIDNDEIDSFVEKNVDFAEFYERASPVRSALKCGAGVIAGLYAIHSSGAPTVLLAAFMECVRTGVGFKSSNDAALKLRNAILKGTVESRFPVTMAASTVIAWNFWISGQSAKSLAWKDSSFPVVMTRA